MALTFTQAQKQFWNHYAQNFIRGPNSFGPQRVTPGKMYTFKYVAKVADFWDQYPLVMMIDVGKKHFLGLSLHYLPPKTREVFVKKMLLYNYKLLKDGKPAKIDYSMIKNANEFYKEGIFLIRKYLKNHIRSKMVEIGYKEWIDAVSGIGNGQWMNITANKVWAEYKDKLQAMYTGNPREGIKAKRLKKRITKYKNIKGYNQPKRRMKYK